MINKLKNITCIIPSAWLPQNPLFPWVFDLMVPINWKPTIDYIIWNLQKWGIENVIILLNKNDDKTYKYLDFRKTNINLEVKKINSNSLWDTIYNSFKYIKTDNILIHLWDTIYNWNIDFSKDNILIEDKKVSSPQKWCFVDSKLDFINKPSVIKTWYKAIIGLYYVKEYKDFFRLLKSNNFYDTFSIYTKNNEFNFQEIKGLYYDLWHLDEYYKSKIDFLRVRSFNSLEYDDFRWIITKKSSNNKKILWEINWFKNLPLDLKNFTPRLLDYKLWKEISYSLEFYWYSSLADIFLYSDYPKYYYENIVDKLFKYQLYVKQNYSDKNFSINNLYDIYLKKTFSRLDTMLENTFLNNLYNKNELIINWKKYKNIKEILSKDIIIDIINTKLYNKGDFTIIHGDMCFSNVLYDTFNWLFKIIDPRWNFWEEWIWWDIKYDFAKLRHSIHWKYEYIISDLFNLNINMELCEFSFIFFNEDSNHLTDYFDNKLKDNWYDPRLICFIEWLLFLSMIPLHSDSLNRQIVMYLTAVILLNEYLFNF